MSIILYSYFRSTAAYRVRIALNLKNLKYEIRPIHLLKNGGEQYQSDYLGLNPQGRVPVMVVDNKVLTQSTAIIEYLEESYPEPPLLPVNPIDRAHVRALAQIVACDIHPLNNLRVLKYLSDTFDEEQKQAWVRHWIEDGFTAIEQLLQNNNASGRFCYGDTPGIADAFLVPQVFNAIRFDCQMARVPLIDKIYQNCLLETAFITASPKNQPDAET